LFKACPFSHPGILPQFSHRAPGRLDFVLPQATPPYRESVLERALGLLSFARKKV
jgi:hypothetical protein